MHTARLSAGPGSHRSWSNAEILISRIIVKLWA